MTIEVSHVATPYKSIGAESIKSVILEKKQHYALRSSMGIAQKRQNLTWKNQNGPCTSFIRVSIAPKLMAVKIQVDESNNLITLTHPEKLT